MHMAYPVACWVESLGHCKNKIVPSSLLPGASRHVQILYSVLSPKGYDVRIFAWSDLLTALKQNFPFFRKNLLLERNDSEHCLLGYRPEGKISPNFPNLFRSAYRDGMFQIRTTDLKDARSASNPVGVPLLGNRLYTNALIAAT